MPRRASAEINTAVANRKKATQRPRLLAGMVAAANRHGYAGANVSAVIAEAGVSRPTFYDYFEDRDDCFIATALDVQHQLLQDVRGAIRESPPESALAAAVRATVAFAGRAPAEARFLMKETLAGGPGALEARDEAIRQTAAEVEKAHRRAAPQAPTPDLPVVAVLGAVQRLLATKLRRGERALEGLKQDLEAWVESYAQPASQQRWRALKPLPLSRRGQSAPANTLGPPPMLGPGRPRLTEEEVAENHRQRIMFATAQVVQERGYTAATVGEITRVAGVDGRAFYRLFEDKQEAFSAIHELGFQYLMAATAAAFFVEKPWPQRIWDAFGAAAQGVDDTPTFAHVAFVEAYAVGPRAIQRVEDSRIAFTIFLQEGYRYQHEGDTPPTRAALEAIITTIFEIVYLQARASAKPKTAGLLAHLVHMCLVPFIGSAEANTLIDKRLAQATRAGPRSRKR